MDCVLSKGLCLDEHNVKLLTATLLCAVPTITSISITTGSDVIQFGNTVAAVQNFVLLGYSCCSQSVLDVLPLTQNFPCLCYIPSIRNCPSIITSMSNKSSTAGPSSSLDPPSSDDELPSSSEEPASSSTSASQLVK